MIRGNHTFNTLFADTPTIQPEKVVKGRDANLNAQKHERLLYRYFYYGFFTDKRHTAIMALLSLEFDLSERRILDIVSDNLERLQAFRKEPPTVRQLRAKYPFLVWD